MNHPVNRDTLKTIQLTRTRLQPATIKLFLVDGRPDSLRTAELSNWAGKALAAPRTELRALLKRPELESPGIYLLTGVESSDDMEMPAVYIGEAENVAKRLKNGHSNKDFWNSVTVFVSKDDNLTKAVERGDACRGSGETIL